LGQLGDDEDEREGSGIDVASRESACWAWTGPLLVLRMISGNFDAIVDDTSTAAWDNGDVPIVKSSSREYTSGSECGDERRNSREYLGEDLRVELVLLLRETNVPTDETAYDSEKVSLDAVEREEGEEGLEVAIADMVLCSAEEL